MGTNNNRRKKAKVAVVCAFLEEQPSHTKYSVKTLVESLSSIEDMGMLLISNGCNVGNDFKNFLSGLPQALLLELSVNIGVPAVWNIGIDLLDCDYLFILNDDLWVDRYCIEEIVRVFETTDNTAVVGVEGVLSGEVGESGFPLTSVKYKKKKGIFHKNKKKIIDVTNVSGLLFAISMEFVRITGFRFDAMFTPAFCEEYDLAFFARSHGYKTRIISGMDRHYDHQHGISSGPKLINYLGKSIWSNELAERNMALFVKKWGSRIISLVQP